MSKRRQPISFPIKAYVSIRHSDLTISISKKLYNVQDWGLSIHVCKETNDVLKVESGFYKVQLHPITKKQYAKEINEYIRNQKKGGR